MGVHGLTPFLRKAYPAVIKNLPERFGGLRGKRIVIDGTLITQRFHFTPSRHPYQHIISWYKFAQDLHENDVSAICLFDGHQRNKAKARETQRRGIVRELTISRASIEQDRFVHLNRVKKTLQSFEQLHDLDRRKVAGLLAADPSFGDSESSTLLQDSFLSEKDGPERDGTEPTPLEPTPLKSFPQDALTPELPEQVPCQTVTTKASEVAAELKLSFLGFKANVAKLATLSADQPQTSPLDLSPEDVHAEKVMSKAQYGLTVNESKFWKDCMTTLTGDTPLKHSLGETEGANHPRDQLESLVDRSSIMVSMYERRTNLPTAKTYSEAREILKALGIQCIEVAGAYEAEALASSMVLAGLADYVVSEDTDVLVYEAPLVRNMTTRHPFLMVCGTDVRTALQLTRDEYIDFAILLGTDFSQRITNVGPVRALSFIKEFGSIENVVNSIENSPKYQLKLSKAAYLAQVDIARSVFKTLPPLPSKTFLESVERNDKQAADILKHYGIYPEHSDWRYEDALVGNFFNDIPIAA